MRMPCTANPRNTSCGLSKEMLASWELRGEALGMPFMSVQLQSLNPLLSCSHACGVEQQEQREVGLLWGCPRCRHLLLGCRQGSREARGEGNSSNACWHAGLSCIQQLQERKWGHVSSSATRSSVLAGGN